MRACVIKKVRVDLYGSPCTSKLKEATALVMCVLKVENTIYKK